MRLTVELPDALMRRVKVQAALSDRQIKVYVAELLELGLKADPRRESHRGSAERSSIAAGSSRRKP
jgi:hypothetical protein